MEPVRVLLSDDHPAIRAALRMAFASDPDLRVVGEADTPEDTRLFAEQTRPDVIVLDLTYHHNLVGIELVRALMRRLPATKIVVFSHHDEMVYAEAVLHAGAVAYVMKDAPVEQVHEAVHRVRKGDIVTSPAVARSLLRSLVPGATGQQASADLRRLSEQERVVLRLVGQGLGTDAIADQLGISRKTAQTHRRRVQRKLGFAEVHELVRFATLWQAGMSGV